LVFKIEDDGGIDAACLHHFPETLDPLACFHHSVTSFGPWFLFCVNIVTTISTMIAAGTEMMTELMPVDGTSKHSQNSVATKPVPMDARPACFVTCGNRNTASSAGVIPAPYTV